MADSSLKDTGFAFFRDGSAGRPSVALGIGLALCMALAKLAFITSNDATTALWEETSIYLNATHLSFGSFLFYPDAGYINFLPKLAAFLTLRVLGLTVVYPLVFKFLSFFLSALAVLVFLSDRFAVFTPSLTHTYTHSLSRWARFFLCLLFFFFPEHDLFASYNASYYVVFLLMWYLLRALDPRPFLRGDCLFILLTGFAAVWSKPLLFPFGPVLLGVAGWWCLRAVRDKGRGLDFLRLFSVFWLVALYGVQFLFCLRYPLMFEASGMAELSRLAGGAAWMPLMVVGRFVMFLGYGLAAPLYTLLGGFSAAFSLAAGACVIWMTISNTRFCVLTRRYALLLSFVTLFSGCLLGVYGILKYDWATTCTFSDFLFSRPWDHRHLFVFVLFSNLQVLLWAGRHAWKRSFWAVCGYSAALTVVSLCVLHPSYYGAFHHYALSWPEARELLREECPLIPIPQLMPEWVPTGELALPQVRDAPYNSRMAGMFFSPSCNWASGVVGAFPAAGAVEGAKGGRFVYRHAFAAPEPRSVRYLLLFPASGDHVILPRGTRLVVEHDGRSFAARLVNPGARGWYLFAFDSAVPSTYTNTFVLETPDGAPPRSAFSVFMAGFWT